MEARFALVDASGGLVTQYAYDPFGNTSVSGSANSNGFQYTGREDEGNGLYFYRARYFSSVLGRFINEDPLSFAGSGPNFYAYVFNNPTNLVDPFGLDAGTLVLGGGRILAGTEIGADVIGGAVTVGEAAPAVGAAGLAGWGIGRGVGHVPLIGGGTVDDGWQDIFTYLFFSQAVATAQTVPLSKAAQGGSGGGGDDNCYDDEDVDNAQQQFPKKAGKPENHHHIPKYLGGPENGPTTTLDGAYHQLITNAFRGKWPYKSPNPPTAEELQQLMKEVYDHFPLEKCR